MSQMNAVYVDEAPELSAEDFYLKHEKALKGTEERFLNGDNTDDEGWRSEALAVIEDIKQFVKLIDISDALPCDENGIYLNLETQEGASLTVELSCAGFRVCGYQFDTLVDGGAEGGLVSSTAPNDNNNKSPAPGDKVIHLNVYYETPYALLDSISPAYRDSFSNELCQRLQELCNK